MRIGIIGAMESEIGGLRDALVNVKVVKKAGMEFFQGIMSDCGNEVIVVKCGVGKVNAGICAEILCECFKVDCLINTGAAGSLNPKIDIGDVVLCTEAVQHDMDCRGFGSPIGKIPFMKTSEFHADDKLRSLAKSVCEKVCTDISVFEGKIATGDQFICDKERKKFITENFGALCCEMEGAAIAQTAFLNEVPFLIIRAISDKADDSAEMDYPAFERMAAWHSIKILTEMVGML
jgi:adenosylhomocysteine nucleosidase